MGMFFWNQMTTQFKYYKMKRILSTLLFAFFTIAAFGQQDQFLGQNNNKVIVRGGLNVSNPDLGNIKPQFAGPIYQIRTSTTKYDLITTTDNGGGTWYRVPGDDSTADNTSTVIVDASGNRYYRQYSGPVDVRWFGAKGDGTANDAAFIQSAINLYTNIYIPDGNYKIDSAILLIKGRQGVSINMAPNARLFTNRHGWGIIEIDSSSNVSITGGILSGSGTFPAKDTLGEDGGGEKHATGGSFGYTRNGDTTNSSPNNFPYKGGRFGNIGIGILIRNGSENITVNAVNIKRFNGLGVQVGFLGESEPERLNYSKNIIVTNCTLDSLYDGGVSFHSVDGVVFKNNTVINIGHPAAVGTDVTIDPGYGIALRRVATAYRAKNVTIDNNYFYNCKRKAIDGHNGEKVTVSYNTCRLSLITGIYMNSVDDPTATDVTIVYNTIDSCGIASGGAVDAKMGIYASFLNAEIANNSVLNSGRSYGILANSRINSNVHDNKIIDTASDRFSSTRRAILVLGTADNHKKNYSITNNYIYGQFQSGIYLDYLDTVDISGNNVVISGTEFMRTSTSTNVLLMPNTTNIVPNGTFVMDVNKPSATGYAARIRNSDTGLSSNGLMLDIASTLANAAVLEVRTNNVRVGRWWSNGNFTIGNLATAGNYKLNVQGKATITDTLRATGAIRVDNSPVYTSGTRDIMVRDRSTGLLLIDTNVINILNSKQDISTVYNRTQSDARYALKLSNTATIDFPSIPANSEGSGSTVTVTGALSGDNVIVSAVNTAGIMYKATVTADNTVTIYPVNITVNDIDPPSTSFKVMVLR